MHDIIHDHDHPHEHIGPDGQVYTHTHAPAEDHSPTHILSACGLVGILQSPQSVPAVALTDA